MWQQIEVILIKGGIMMIPLVICSFLVILISLERLIILRISRQVPKKGLDEWKETFSADGALRAERLTNSHTIVGKIMSKMVGVLPLTQKRLEERIGDLARIEKHRLERGLVVLDTIAGIAPLFGLLGTALGMVEVFSRLSLMDEAKMNALSSGISQALFTTVAGLIIGIPSLIAFNLFTRRVDSLMLQAEEQINMLLDEYYTSFVCD